MRAPSRHVVVASKPLPSPPRSSRRGPARSSRAVRFASWIGIATSALAAACSHDPNTFVEDSSSGTTEPTPAPSATTTTPPQTNTDADAGDASPAAACDVTKPFGAPTLMPSAGLGERGARWDGPKRNLVFTRERNGGPSSTFAMGPSLVEPTTTPFAQIQGSSSVYYPAITPDGLTLFYQRYSGGSALESDVWVATRADATAAFGSAQMLSVASSGDDYEPYVTSSGEAIYWARYTPGDQRWHVMRWPLKSAGAVTEVFTAPDTSSYGTPVVTADEKTLYLMVERAPSLDVFVATRASTDVPFGVPTRVDELSTPTLDEAPTWVSDDQCEILIERFGADRPSMYVARRP